MNLLGVLVVWYIQTQVYRRVIFSSGLSSFGSGGFDSSGLDGSGIGGSGFSVARTTTPATTVAQTTTPRTALAPSTTPNTTLAPTTTQATTAATTVAQTTPRTTVAQTTTPTTTVAQTTTPATTGAPTTKPATSVAPITTPAATTCGFQPYPVDFREQRSGWIASPNYPNDYPNGYSCAWRITGNNDTFVGIQFIDFCLEQLYDFVSIYNGATSSAGLIASLDDCGNPGSFNSTGSQMFITFSSDESTTYKGFNLTWQIYDQA